MTELIKELVGYSDSKVLLLQNNNVTFVRKVGDISRNLERYSALSSLSIPKIISFNEEYYDMEYIPNLDIKTYLTRFPTTDLIAFIKDVLFSSSLVH